MTAPAPPTPPSVGLDARAARRRLEELAEAPVGRSKTAMLADVLDEVERALRGSASRAQVIEALRLSGLGFSAQTFAKTLARLRARRRAREAGLSAPGKQASRDTATATWPVAPSELNARQDVESLLRAPHEREMARLQSRLAEHEARATRLPDGSRR